jgi:hypothetical protein
MYTATPPHNSDNGNCCYTADGDDANEPKTSPMGEDDEQPFDFHNREIIAAVWKNRTRNPGRVALR